MSPGGKLAMLINLIILLILLALTILIFEKIRRLPRQTFDSTENSSADDSKRPYLSLIYGLPTTLLLFLALLLSSGTNIASKIILFTSILILLVYMLKCVGDYRKEPQGNPAELWNLALLWFISMSAALTAAIAFVIFAIYLI
jgi:uncharacterized membrane protein